MNELSEVIKFTAPLWIINMSLNLLYIAKKYWPQLSKFDIPLDGNMLLGGKPLLGKSTTWPGLAMAGAVGLLASAAIYHDFKIGLLAGVCVYFGHALGSFIKRRRGLDDGQYMLGVDHGDYIVLSGIVFGILGIFSWPVILYGIIITYILHPIATFLSYRLGLHKYPW